MSKGKKKKRLIKNLIIGCLAFAFVATVFVFGFLKNHEIFSSNEIIFYEPPKKIDMEPKIDVKEVSKNIDNMTMEEVEDLINEIEKEIKRLESNLD